MVTLSLLPVLDGSHLVFSGLHAYPYAFDKPPLLWWHHCGPCHIFGWCSWLSRFLTTAAFTSGRLKGRNETSSYSCTTYLQHLNLKIRTIQQFLDNYNLCDRQRYWFSGRTEPGGASNSVIMPHTDQSICPLADVFKASVSKPNTASD